MNPLAIEKKLTDIWTSVLELERIGVDDDFFDLGGDSLSAAHLVVEIEKVLGQNILMGTLVQNPTVRRLGEIIGQNSAPSSSSALVALKAQGTKPPFFCVHGVGGAVHSMVELARHFATDQPFYALRAVSQNGSNEADRSIEELAAEYLAAIRTLQADGPYYLGGYSFGGSVALEMAQQLHAQGRKVACLAILDHTPPPTRYQTAFWSPAGLLEFFGNLPLWLRDDLFRAGSSRVFHRFRLLGRSVLRRMRSLLGRTPSDSGAPEVDAFFDLARIPEQFRRLLVANYRALRAYVPKVYPGRVTLFRARTRPLLRMHGLDLGWSKLAGGGLDIHVIPGNHETILKQPNVQVLAARLQSCLASNRVAPRALAGAGFSS
jgi:thioesterase domain-containing protein/acyl carrier protein